MGSMHGEGTYKSGRPNKFDGIDKNICNVISTREI